MKILAVDDDPMMLELLEATLSSSGYTDVSLASSAHEALEMIDQALAPYRCILLDIQMPGMDGIELCKRIRAQELYKQTPILMITAMTERSFVERAFIAGANDYVSKPFDPFELVTRLRLAEQTIQQNRVVAEKIFALQNLKKEYENRNRFAPDQAISIQDIDGVVDEVELENFVLQMSRSEQYNSVAVGFRIEEFDGIHARAKPSELFLTLTDVAECIADQFKQSNFIMSYVGSGIYVVLTHRASPALTDDLQRQIQFAINDLGLEYDDGSQCRVTLAMGAVKSKSLFFGGSPTATIHDAIESARTAISPLRLSHQGNLHSIASA
ncbi:response regulator transcription factor [Mesobaculum littorinae]|uniref:Response regulator transcription factor n=1 Tax=Mesobaculum littorinae TaxID=2486419 RepID=A0A438AIS8_9RHOB|nr:response regulator [Mesobaculum littorinae]RVV98564.1 response regulator transcription factor [Mesobaculum littorinae]